LGEKKREKKKRKENKENKQKHEWVNYGIRLPNKQV